MLACADIEEGIVLRQAGVRVPILVFGALSVSDLDGLFEYALTPTISTPGAARAVQAAAAQAPRRRSAYHLKIDTGMNRLGFRHDNLRRTLPELLASAESAARCRVHALRLGRCTREPRSSTQQRERFERRRAVVDDLLVSGSRRQSAHAGDLRHAANSAATLRDSRVWYDAVRPGLLLYGIVPPPLASTIPLKPVMSLTSRIVAVKGLRPGEGVGYGWRFTAESPRTDRGRSRWYADGLDTPSMRPRTRADSRQRVPDRRRRVDGHDHRRCHRASTTCSPATKSSSSAAGRGELAAASTRARWPPRSGRFRGRSSAVSAARIERQYGLGAVGRGRLA